MGHAPRAATVAKQRRRSHPSNHRAGPTFPVAHAPVVPQTRRAAPASAAQATLRLWVYRVWLVAATTGLCAVLLWLQSLLGAVPAHPTRWQAVVQWAELIWLCPVPVALALWIGWFLFGEMALPDPVATDVPRVRRRRSAPLQPANLVFRIVTRGDNLDVLRESVAAIHESVARYSAAAGPYRVEVVSERPVDVQASQELTRVYVVPATYVPAHRTRFKARALAYLQSQVRLDAHDWCIYLDEESMVDTVFLAGIYAFIRRVAPGGRPGSQQAPCPIGQGAILYQGDNWFFRGADALRTADDLGRFRMQYALGVPLFGIHGSYIVVHGSDDATLSFDVGERNSLTEDAAWSLRAWARGYRFAWVAGNLYEQPPQSLRDFVRQRARWLAGIRRVLRDRVVPARFRLCLGVFSALWQLSFLPFVVAIAALLVHIAPFAWMRLAADFAWACYVLAYVQGADRGMARQRQTAGTVQTDRNAQRGPLAWLRALWPLVRRMLAWTLALCYIWYALLEAIGVLWSLVPEHSFFVIRKPGHGGARKLDSSALRMPEMSQSKVSHQ